MRKIENPIIVDAEKIREALAIIDREVLVKGPALDQAATILREILLVQFRVRVKNPKRHKK